jgi:hypothetical protein
MASGVDLGRRAKHPASLLEPGLFRPRYRFIPARDRSGPVLSRGTGP